MKKIITAFIFCFLCGECFSQAGEWVWMHGSSSTNSPGNYGVQGVPSPLNDPPGLYEPCEWTDLNGNFWLFGGILSSFAVVNDLWKYDIQTNEWTWMKGPGTPNNPGSYGVQGIPSITNNPPSRGYGMTSWVDSTGNLWMFGGNANGFYNDLWRYDIVTNEWTWMKGSNQANQPGVYGTQGIPAASNTPSCRSENATSWVDNSRNLWLFGGYYGIYYNDLWKYDISSGNWTWMKGANLANQPAVYGIKGVEDSANTPGIGSSYSSWKDNNGNFWMFCQTDYLNYTYLNVLWRYNPVTNKWAWMGGDTLININSIYGSKCVSSPNNVHGARYENRVTWRTADGNLLTFGGYIYQNSVIKLWNDLWTYNIASGEWMWVSGDSTVNPLGNWGTMGVSSPLNVPDGRFGAIGWTNDNQHLYFFGGRGPLFSFRNDLWKYTIDTACVVTSVRENDPPKVDELLVFPNPTNSSFTISFSSSEKQSIELRIYNTLGKQVYVEKEEITKGKFEKEINVEKWSEGIYFLQLKTKEENTNKKIIINH